jgi:hypothetical protein
MVQSNSIAGALEVAFGIDPWITGRGIVMAVCTGFVLLGGVKRIGAVAEKLVPFMCIGYIVASLIVLGMYADQIPGAFVLIFDSAPGIAHRADRLRELRQPAVMRRRAAVLTNKYAEGYPGKRYYGGCEHVDVVEQLAIDRAKQLFGADYANVQPHSGSQANAAVYMALLQPHDTVLGHEPRPRRPPDPRRQGQLLRQDLQRGAVRPRPETGEIDYDQVEPLAREHKPKMIVAGFSAYSRIIDWQRFRDIADRRRRLPVRRHGARRRPGGRRPVPEPGALRRRRHHHHPQDPARDLEHPEVELAVAILVLVGTHGIATGRYRRECDLELLIGHRHTLAFKLLALLIQ